MHTTVLFLVFYLFEEKKKNIYKCCFFFSTTQMWAATAKPGTILLRGRFELFMDSDSKLSIDVKHVICI